VTSDAQCVRYDDSWSTNVLGRGCFSKSTDDLYIQDATADTLNTYLEWRNVIRETTT
jgi:hypothetical protein